jgi:hypothetical protein
MQERLDRLDRIEKRMARMERLLNDVVKMVPPSESKRLTERQVCEHYGVSKHLLRHLRLGYKLKTGEQVLPKLFKWGHRNGRNFDYDREEVEQILGRVQI